MLSWQPGVFGICTEICPVSNTALQGHNGKMATSTAIFVSRTVLKEAYLQFKVRKVQSRRCGVDEEGEREREG